MNAMVLAAGKGVRLHPLTETVPKPMLPVAGQPVLAHILLWLHHYGIRQVVINLHHRPEVVRDYFGDGSRFGLEIFYSEEPVLLGTAGGVKKAEDFLDDSFIVVYGDVLTDLDLGGLLAFHEINCRGTPHATLTLDRRPDVEQGGVVDIGPQDRIQRFIEKPKPGVIRSPWINSGIMILDKEMLKTIPAGRFCDFGHDVLPDWLCRGLPLFGWKMPEGFYLIDMGTPEKLAQADRNYAKRIKAQSLKSKSGVGCRNKGFDRHASEVNHHENSCNRGGGLHRQCGHRGAV